MTHMRQQIRDAVAALINGGALVGSNVYKMRFRPLDDRVTTAVCVYTTEEAVRQSSMGMGQPARQDRFLTVMLEAYTIGPHDTVFNSMDAICVEIEHAMAADPNLSGLVKSVELTNCSFDVNTEGNKAIASAALTYLVKYRTDAADVENAA